MRQADELVQEAYQRHQKGDFEFAEKAYDALLNTDFDNPYLMYLRGTVAMQKGHNGLALVLLSRAIEAKEARDKGSPGFSEAWSNMGCAFKNEGHVEMALKCFQRAIEINPTDPELHNNLATIYVAAGMPEKAIELCDRALEIKPDCQDAKWNKALALLELMRWREAWPLYDEGKRRMERRQRFYHPDPEKTPEWDGRKCKNLIVYGEQGIGDEIMFASMLFDAAARCETLIFDCHPRLYPIWSRSLSIPNLVIFPTRKESKLMWPVDYQDHYRTAIGSLGQHFRNDLSQFPDRTYIKADPLLSVMQKARLDAVSYKPKVGISWAGGTKQSNGPKRSIPIQVFAEFVARHPEIEFVSLQYQEHAEQELPLLPGVHHWRKTIDDYDETCALVDSLDLVISVRQAVVHLAGAMGKPCWALTAHCHPWQHAHINGRSPWYSSLTCIEQGPQEEWAETLSRVSIMLNQWVSDGDRATRVRWPIPALVGPADAKDGDAVGVHRDIRDSRGSPGGVEGVEAPEAGGG